MTNVTNTNITQVFLPNELKTTAAAVTTAKRAASTSILV